LKIIFITIILFILACSSGEEVNQEENADSLPKSHVNNIDKNRPLRLFLSGVFSELPVPPFLVKEWRSLS